MTAVDVIRRLHEHRLWVNHKLLAAAAAISEDALRRPFAIGQGSIWKSLCHLYASDYVWLEALLGDERPLLAGDLPGQLPGNQQGQGAVASLTELNARWGRLMERWQAYLQGLTAESLDEMVFKVSTSVGQGKRFATRRGDVLLHVCTHAQYTTAQIVNMLRHAGAASLPDAMLISLAREQMAGD